MVILGRSLVRLGSLVILFGFCSATYGAGSSSASGSKALVSPAPFQGKTSPSPKSGVVSVAAHIGTISFRATQSIDLRFLEQAATQYLMQNPGFSAPGPRLARLLADLTAQLRAADYPIAQVVFVPADQSWGGGNPSTSANLVLRVYLGEVGKISLENASIVEDSFLRAQFEDALCGGALANATESIVTHCILQGRNLERATALLKAVPGVQDASVSLSSNEVALGQTHLTFLVKGPKSVYRGYVSADNYGIPSSGVGRLGVVLGATSLIRAGDSFDANVYVTNESYWTGLLDWNQPIGDSGLRLDAQLSQMQFTSALGGGNSVNGKAQSVMVGLVDPLVFHFDQVQNLQINAGYTKSTSAIAGQANYQDRNIPFVSVGVAGNSGLRPASNFSESFYAWNGRLTNGKVTDSAQGADQMSAATSQVLNNFTKINAGLQMRQPVGDLPYYWGANIRGQGANRNLDPSLMMSFGGIDGIRAYPITEGSFTNGAIGTLEFKRNFTLAEGATLVLGAFSEYVVGQTYRNTWPGWNSANPSIGNTRHLSGYGLSADVYYQKFSASIVLANRFGFSQTSVSSNGSFDGRIWAIGRWSF